MKNHPHGKTPGGKLATTLLMRNPTPYLKMRVLGAIDMAEGKSIQARIKAVSLMTFTDEDGQPRQFTWRTIQTWFSRYQKHGVTVMENQTRSDKGKVRKVTLEDVLEALRKVRPKVHGKTPTLALLYRLCIEAGLLTRAQIAPNTFRRVVKQYELLKPDEDCANKHRLAFAKAHANEMWQADTLYGPYVQINGSPVQTRLIAFLDDASRVCCHGQFFLAENVDTLIEAIRAAYYKRGVPHSLYVDYVPRNIIHILCPAALCGQPEYPPANAGESFRGWPHNFQRAFSHFRSSASSRQTERVGRVAGEPETGGWQASNAFCFIRRLISA